MNVKDLFYEDIEVEDLFNDGDGDDPDYVPSTKKKTPKRGILINCKFFVNGRYLE